MWQALITYFWLYVRTRNYHKTHSRHSRRHSERITEWAPTERVIDVIMTGTEMIVRHRVVRI